MEQAVIAQTERFRRHLFGYRAREVDAYVAAAAAAEEAARAEIERLQAAEPLTRVPSDVAALLSSFADTVASVRDNATEAAERAKREAEEYAALEREECDRLVAEASEVARKSANELMSKARAEVGLVADRAVVVERVLLEASDGINLALDALRRLGDLSRTVTIDLGDASQAGAPTGRDAESQRADGPSTTDVDQMASDVATNV